jgi:tetratricopeptide (TPR) repeat protein
MLIMLVDLTMFVCGKRKGTASENFRGSWMPKLRLMPNADMDDGRPREAIECYNHALTYSDQYDSSIHLKIADIYDVDLEEYAAAAAHHRRVVEISKAKGTLASVRL